LTGDAHINSYGYLPSGSFQPCTFPVSALWARRTGLAGYPIAVHTAANSPSPLRSRRDGACLSHGFDAQDRGRPGVALGTRRSWSMAELRKLRKKHGLEGLAVLLVRNDVDILPDLTEQDLERLRLSLGQQGHPVGKKDGWSDRVGRATASAVRVGPSVPREAERRQITSMFCGLVGLDRTIEPARSRGHEQIHHWALYGFNAVG
jgi:hypothetical protein